MTGRWIPGRRPLRRERVLSLNALLLAVAAAALLLAGCSGSPWVEPQGGPSTWSIAEGDRLAQNPWSPEFPSAPFGASFVAWVSDREVAYSSDYGVSILDVESGTTRRLGQPAYLLSSNQNGLIACASATGLTLARADGTSETVLGYEELSRLVGLAPISTDVATSGSPSGIPVLEVMAWSPAGDRLALLVQRRSTVSLTDASSSVVVIGIEDSLPRLCLQRDGLDGRIRLVGWLDQDRLVIFHNDYLEPDDDYGWANADIPVTPTPTASVDILDLAGPGGLPGAPVKLLALPWHSRVSLMSATADGQVVLGIFQSPLGSRVAPRAGSFVLLPAGKTIGVIPEGLRPLTAPDAEGRYLAVTPDGVLGAVHGKTFFKAGATSDSLAVVPGAGHWTFGLCASADGTKIVEAGRDRIRVFRCGW